MKVEFVDSVAEEHGGVQPVLAALEGTSAEIASSTYYAHKTRPASPRSVRDEQLTKQIRKVHEENMEVYGARKVWREEGVARDQPADTNPSGPAGGPAGGPARRARRVRRARRARRVSRVSRARRASRGEAVARCTVERLMRAAGLRGVVRDKHPRTTRPAAETDRPADLVDRDVTATRPDQLWVADLTYVRTMSGWVYAAFVLEVYSRMIVGWQVATSLYTDLALDALQMGIWRRQRDGHDLTGLVHHSDRGVQYRAIRYTQRLAEADAVTSVGVEGRQL